MVSLNTLAGLVGGMEGFQQYQKDQQKRQMEQIDLLDRQARLRLDQQKADAEQAAMLRSQNADKNAAAVLQGIYGGTNPQAQPPVPPPQAPPPQQMAPGQPSVPMQQANQQRPPIPAQGVQGQMPPAGTPPLPQGQPGQAPARPQPQQQAQPAPYQRIDTQMQQRQQAQQAQAAQQQATDLANSPIPPEENSLTFQGAVRMLQAKGIQGPAMIDALDRLTPYLDRQAKQQAQALKDQLAIQKSALDAAKFELQGKHDAALEANANARLSVEAQRVRIEAARAANASQNEAMGNALKAEQIKIDEAKLDREGIPAGYERDPKTNGLRPMQGGPYDPKSPNYRPPKGAQSQAPLGSREEAYLHRTLNSANQALQGAKNIMDLPITTKTLGIESEGPGLMNASKRWLTTKLTDQDIQDYDTMRAGIDRSLATLEASGLAPPGSLTGSMGKSTTINVGDTQLTKLRKMAELRQIAVASLEPNLADPRVPKEQKDYIKQLVDGFKTSIPFTQEDITKLEKAQRSNPQATLADVAKQKGLGTNVPEDIQALVNKYKSK